MYDTIQKKYKARSSLVSSQAMRTHMAAMISTPLRHQISGKTMVAGLVHHVVCLCTSQLLPVLNDTTW